MNSKAICNSVRKAGTVAVQHTRTILNWFQPIQNTITTTIQRHQLDNLVHNAYLKKRKYKTRRAVIGQTEPTSAG